YSAATLNLTYGVTDDLDVNVALPIATLDLGLDVTRQNPSGPILRASSTAEAATIAAMLVRAKYRLFEPTGSSGSAAAAAGLRVRIPTGNPTRGLGTGYGQNGADLALSASVLEGRVASL